MVQQWSGLPKKQGLYDPANEHDACGIGVVVRINGEKSHDIIVKSLRVLNNLSHRGGAGSEDAAGDGAGVLTQIPDKFLRRVCPSLRINLPPPGDYGLGMVFMPRDEALRNAAQEKIEQAIAEEGLTVLGWRTLPINESSLGSAARANRPDIRQIIIRRPYDIAAGDAFERMLYIIRRRCEQLAGRQGEAGSSYFYFASLSSRTVVYKGMLTASQLDAFYLDLQDLDFESAIALVHSRYSTNTFPSWERAHPYRYLIHNGEINTLRGNINWMKARESTLQTNLFGPDLSRIMPLLNEEGSDSAIFDNCLEFLYLAGRPLPHAAMMMVPEPWIGNENMPDQVKAFYEYHSTLMEPWDGPAAMVFTDGTQVAAILDRNGLRPSRYTITTDGLLILASETGVLDIDPEKIARRDRLRAGRMLLIDTKEGRIISNAEIKELLSCEKPYREWLAENLVGLDDLPQLPVPGINSNDAVVEGVEDPASAEAFHGNGGYGDVSSVEREAVAAEPASLEQREKAFGYTFEDIRSIMLPMAANSSEPVGSMGCDTPIAVLSDKPQLLYSYFKQLFAQVTNPPIDAQREAIVISTTTYLGSDGNLIDPQPENCRQIRLDSPVLSDQELLRIRRAALPGFSSEFLPILMPAGGGGHELEAALDDLFARADAAVADGRNILILSDRGFTAEKVAIPALLAVAGLHHHLLRQKTRSQVSLIVESAEPREVHHFALLVGYGASAVNPYLAYEIISDAARNGYLSGMSADEACSHYRKAALKGLVKIISKMGISTIQSYQGAQIFEALGIGQAVIDRYFTATPSPIGGIGLREIASTVNERWTLAFADPAADPGLPSGGKLQWRSDGEYHLFNPMSVHLLQQACRTGDFKLFQDYSKLLNEETQRLSTLRGLLNLVPAAQPVPLDQVEPVDAIVRRFKTGAMSYGSISQEAHEALAVAMNRLGGRSNTGEGGEDPARFVPLANGDSRCSAIKQVASGRFGVTSHYLVNANELQIKIAQGAKPGEGGQLPGRKVYPWIARTRHATPGVALISPPPHHDIYSIEDLAELIHELKNANDQARISVKLVSEIGVGTVAAGVAKGRADVVLISGYDGGTGASPRTSIQHAGLPWELGLAETHQTLLLNNLRGRIVVEADGKLLTGRDVAIAALLGAEEFGFATGPLVALGCVMMRVCNLDTCPVGVATQNPALRARFAGKPEYVENFMRFIAQELREIMASLGFRTVGEMVGRTDRLSPDRLEGHPRAAGLDLSPLLYQPKLPDDSVGREQHAQNHKLDQTLDQKLIIPVCLPAIEQGQGVTATFAIRNVNRVVGTQLGSLISRKYGAAGLPNQMVSLTFRGSAGQSFGAFLPSGVTMRLEGDTNDYVGKGLSGGKIIVVPPQGSQFRPEENIIVGNVALYGATGGEFYGRGQAGERFCIRNSGVRAVIEGVGDHGCEYMTGGRAVILGKCGRNFAAGMSGGIAYVLDEDGSFRNHCNMELVELFDLSRPQDEEEVLAMIKTHRQLTGSEKAERVLNAWRLYKSKFVKVFPIDYRKMLNSIQEELDAGLTGDEALLAAYNRHATAAVRNE